MENALLGADAAGFRNCSISIRSKCFSCGSPECFSLGGIQPTLHQLIPFLYRNPVYRSETIINPLLEALEASAIQMIVSAAAAQLYTGVAESALQLGQLWKLADL